MRTTLTLDPDVAERIRMEGRSGKRSQKQIINEALRRGLGGEGGLPAPKPFKVKPFRSAFRAGIDIGKLNQLVDELEVEAQTQK
jgi:hypothetical protein